MRRESGSEARSSSIMAQRMRGSAIRFELCDRHAPVLGVQLDQRDEAGADQIVERDLRGKALAQTARQAPNLRDEAHGDLTRDVPLGSIPYDLVLRRDQRAHRAGVRLVQRAERDRELLEAIGGARRADDRAEQRERLRAVRS